MACQQLDAEAVNNSTEIVVCELCADADADGEEQQEATCHCDDCLANFCDRCAESHGKLRASGACHRIEKGVCHYDLEMELCPEDGQKMSFYCRTCRVRVCPECELDNKRHVMHVVVSLTRLVGQEKEKLLDKLDDVTTKTETISHVPDEIKSIRTHIELKWLERKEMIRQEFVSLFDTISTQQQKLLADMDEEVKKSLDRLDQLQQDHDDVLSNTCQLSDDCISAVQNLPRGQFMNSYPQFLESVKQLEHKVERMQSAEDQMPVFLKVPFSLYKEKLHLHNSLQLSTFNLQGIKAREQHRFVPFDRLHEELSVYMLLDTPLKSNLPPSSTLRYTVDIYCGSKHNKKPVWSSKKPMRAIDTVFNGEQGVFLSPGNLYMVKIQPILTCSTHTEEQTVEGRVISIVIVTDTAVGSSFITDPVMAAGDSHMAAPDTRSLLNTTFESCGEENLSCVNFTATGGNTNNSCSTRASRGRGWIKLIKTFTTTSKPPPFVDSFNSPLALHGSRGGWGLHNGDKDEQVPLTKVCYKPSVPAAQADVEISVPTMEGTLCSQRRYIADCSFEEARLMEDSTLQVSRVILFDH